MKNLFVVSSFLIMVLMACRGEQPMLRKPRVKDDAELLQIAKDMAKLRSKKIFFGHHSVGNNIIDGLKQIAAEDPRFKLDIQKDNKGYNFDHSLFAHAGVGQNMNPRSKCDDFLDWMKSGFGGKVDIAFFKFCFVDINSDSDPKEIFDYYRKTMEHLENAYPDMKFVYVTVPLMTRPGGTKNFVKRLINYHNPDIANIKHCEFNQLLRSHYQGKKPIFDLAAVESTYPDGRRNGFNYKDKMCFSLIPEYTNDGGHLDELGRYRAAKELLLLLTKGMASYNK